MGQHGVVRATLRDSRGITWFGDNPNGLCWIQGDRVRNFSVERNLATLGLNGALSLAEGPNGRIWIGTFDSGLWCYDPAQDNRPDQPLDLSSPAIRRWDQTTLGSNHVSALLVDRSGTLWVGTGNGEVFQWNGQEIVPLED